MSCFPCFQASAHRLAVRSCVVREASHCGDLMMINGDFEWGYNVCVNAIVTIPKWWVCGAGGPTLIWMNGLWSMMVMFFSDYSTQTNGLMAYGHGKKGFLIYHGYSSIPMDVFTMAHSEHRNWRYLPGLLRQ